VMESMLALSIVQRGFERQSDQSKDYKILIFAASPLSMHY
jgi:hypothetical protein